MKARLKKSSPSMHRAPGRHHRLARTYYSTEFVLADSIFPLQKGKMLSVFFFGPRGLTHRKYSIFPLQKGEILSFFCRPCLGT